MGEALLLHVRERGESGPAVVALHGLFGSGDNLAGLAAELADEYRVLLPDLRNHGRSPWSETTTLAAMAGDIKALLDREQLEQAVLVGHSLGGKVAMELALQAPERVSALIVADIAPVAYPPHHQTIFEGLAAVEQAAVRWRTDADSVLAQHVEDPMVRGFLLKSLAAEIGPATSEGGAVQPGDRVFHWRFNWHVLQRDYEELGAAPEGAPFPGPALFIKGEQSNYILPEHETEIRKRFPHFEFRMIAGTGHWLHAEKPVIFNRLVRDFMQRHEGG